MDCPKCGAYIDLSFDDKTCPVCANKNLAEIVNRAVKRAALNATVHADMGNIGVSVHWRGLMISVTYEDGKPTIETPIVRVYRQMAPGWLNDKMGGHQIDLAAGFGVKKLATKLTELTTHV